MAKKTVVKKKSVEPIKCVWGLVCSMSAIDQENNNISLFNVIDQLNIKDSEFSKLKKGNSVLGLNLAHELNLLWRRTLPLNLCVEKILTDVKLRLIDPNGKVLNEILTPLQFPGGKRLMRFRIRIDGFKVTIPGDYVYKIEIIQPGSDKFTPILEVPLQVIAINQ
jgi:hypothetical protein